MTFVFPIKCKYRKLKYATSAMVHTCSVFLLNKSVSYIKQRKLKIIH